MADIELVIKIDEDYYEIIKHGVEHGSDYKPWSLIAHGTPLPKGHGDLIDTNEITAFRELECNGHNVESLNEFTVIIEADKESEET